MTHWNEGKNTTLAREEAQHWHSIVKQTRELQLGALELGQVWEEAWQGWAKAWSPRGPWRAPGPCHVVTAPHTENRGHQPHGAAPLSPSSCRWGISGQANRKHLLSDPPHPRTAHKILCRRNKGVWELLYCLKASVTRAVMPPRKRMLSQSFHHQKLHWLCSLARQAVQAQSCSTQLSAASPASQSNSCLWGSRDRAVAAAAMATAEEAAEAIPPPWSCPFPFDWSFLPGWARDFHWITSGTQTGI